MGRLISKGHFTTPLLFPLGLLITCILREFIYTYYFQISTNYPSKGSLLILSFLIIFPKMFSGIFYILSFFLTKKPNNKKLITTIIQNERVSIESKNTIISKKENFSYPFMTLMLVIMSLFDITGLFFSYLPRSKGKGINVLFTNIHIIPRSCFIFVTCFLCHKILKYVIRRHHLFSFILIGIGVLSYATCMILWVVGEGAESIEYGNYGTGEMIFMGYGILFFNYGSIALIEVLEKFLMEIHYVNCYAIVFFEGLFDCILFMFYVIVFCDFKNDFVAPFKDMLRNNILGFILSILGKIGYDVCRIQTNYNFTPTHRFIVDMLHSFMLLFMINLSEKEQFFLVFAFGGFVFCFSGSLIYNELVILYCCNLNYYTTFEIEERGSRESKLFIKETNHLQNTALVPEDKSDLDVTYGNN